MTATILSGTEPAQAILKSIKDDVAKLDPKLVIVQIGDNAASNSYIRQKTKSCEQVGMRFEHKKLPLETTFEQLMELITSLNADDDITGFILQLPLPEHLTVKLPQLIRAIDPKKDVDGFGAYNLGKVFLETRFEHLPPATPAGVVALLEYYNIEVSGKNMVVIGHSNTVGKPLGVMLLNRDATVTVCHKHTKNLEQYTSQADIVCIGIGKRNIVTTSMVKPEAVVIDIGFNQTDSGITGDIDFESFKNHVQAITPVPGGIGPMTVASLLNNVVIAKKRQLGLIE